MALPVTPEIAAAVAWVLCVGAAGGLLTRIRPWREELRRPRLRPPERVFGPAWALLLALAGASAVFAWRAAPDDAARNLVIGLFVLNGALNVLWNVLFFTLRRPDRALIEIAFMWLSILAPVIVFWRFSETASLLLVPYLIWVSFASYLNYEVVRLNRPFGSGPKPPNKIDRVREA